ncbi:hypothetical protein FJ976_02830 [Mesorhizobium sp. B1-1-9]|uniref:hypothetical protein n=1 Tax=Mesorhizobium sp. B1-1-9 TaxID=2589975 RepID=UPI001129AA17|nr:hypothetical protein [Mesorhizobium sp. B1-1-9]TPN57589.1 hypothetical protein FJ976_02830 [Mesorhizobium sp. B1-1-9]
MNRTETLKSRWRPEWSDRPDLKRLHGAFNKALHFIESLPAHRAELAKPGNLSPKGMNDSLRALAAEKVVPDLRRAMWESERTANGLKNDLSRLAVPRQHDKTDVAGAMLRGEIRTMLRGMGHGERVGLVMSDPAFLTAAFEGPAALSGLTEELRTDLERRMIEQAHGPAIEAINGAKAAVELTRAAIEMAVSTVKTEGDFGNDQLFNSWMATASAEVEREIAAEKATTDKLPNTAEALTVASYRFKDGEVVRDGFHTFQAAA